MNSVDEMFVTGYYLNKKKKKQRGTFSENKFAQFAIST